ncbi:formin-like protein 18 [Gossypium australe]|uniref:Formin-like protein n=1 Tax=Gossypium australe TaxID=47621 RepID=A0A5B6W7F2_9ROSI|nr:formin-like protein 18 [Gossypium australe]
MGLFSKLFYKKPPDGLLEICEGVYVFDYCFTIDAWEEENYKVYIEGILTNLQEHFPDASFLVFNFCEGETQSSIAELLSKYDMTIMDYPRHYEGCQLVAMEVLHHFLRSCESWLSLGQHNFLLMHCERGGWPVLAFVLAALLLYRKQYSGEQKTLDMIYRQAPREVLQLFSPLNPVPSQLRYLQYVCRRNVGSEWPPLDRALTLDCVILRCILDIDGYGGCRPIFRIYGQDPFLADDKTPKKECSLVKIDINCHIQGDVVVECINLNDDMEREGMIFRAVFNTAFIRSNILMLNRDEIDTLWDTKELFPKEFTAEILFSELDAATSVISLDFFGFEEKGGLPMEAFAKVHEIFSNVDWLDPRADVAFNMLQQMGASNIVQEMTDSPRSATKGLQETMLTVVLPSSPRSPRSMSMKILPALPKKSSLDSDASKEAKPEVSDMEPFSWSDVKHQHSNQSTANLHDSKLSVSQVGHLTAAAAVVNDSQVVSHTPKVDENISVSPQTSLYVPVQPPPTSSTTKALPHPPPPPPLPSSLSSASEPAKPSLATEAGTYLHDKDQTALPEDQSLKASSCTYSPATAAASTVRPPLTPPNKEIPAVRMIPPAPPPPPPTPPSKGNGVSCKTSPSLEENIALSAMAPVASTSSPLNKIEAVRDGPLAVPPPPPPPSIRAIPPAPRPPPTPPAKVSGIHLEASPSLEENLRATTPATPIPPPPPSPAPIRAGSPVTPPPPPPPPMPLLKVSSASKSAPLPPPPPPLHARQVASSVPPPPPPTPALASKSQVPAAPPPPASFGKKTNGNFPEPQAVGSSGSSAPGQPPFTSPTNSKNRLLSRTISSKSHQTKKLKPLHWLKLPRAVQGSLWAEAQKLGKASKAPEIDMSELENLFSAAAPNTARGGKSNSHTAHAPKSEKVTLSSVLALDESALDVDQVDNLIKVCPTKEEMELLKGYTGENEKLGKCEQFFLELMKIPRVESKLRVFSFKKQFRSQGTARGSAIGFRLDSLLKLTDTRARNSKMTLMHYLCKVQVVIHHLDSCDRNHTLDVLVLAEQLPEVLDFSKDISSLEPASKIQLKFLAEEMQAISKGLEKVLQELSSSENDGPVSEIFRENLKEFLSFAEAKVRSLTSLYSTVGRNVDALILYFGEDPARCPFEQGKLRVYLVFTSSSKSLASLLFNKAHEENCKQLENGMKKLSESEKLKMNASQKNESENLLRNGNSIRAVKVMDVMDRLLLRGQIRWELRLLAVDLAKGNMYIIPSQKL